MLDHLTDLSKSKEDILKRLIDEYAQQIKRLIYTYVRDWAAADDITQEIFVKCYLNLDSFRGDSSYKTWL